MSPPPVTRKKSSCAKVGCLGLLLIGVLPFLVTLFIPDGPERPKTPDSSATRKAASPSPEETAQDLPAFRILEETPYDAPIKTQVDYRVVVEGQPDAAAVQALLEHLLARGEQRRGFKHHGGRATHVFAYVYPTEKHSGAQWVGMVSKIGGDAEPSFEVKEELLGGTKVEGEERFGLSVEERKAVFREAFLLERDALAKAEASHPLPSAGSSQDAFRAALERQSAEQERLEDESRADLLKSHGISRDDLDNIIVEGFQSNWPQPR